MNLTVRLLQQTEPQRWRNGGGSTRELLAWPPDTPHWQCRISVAEVAQDGPFSAYAGIERWFAVVAGHGVLLQFGADTQALRPADAPHRFDGAAAPGCRLIDGATQDLNLMLRRDAGVGAMQLAAPGVDWTSAAPLRALYCSGPARLQVDGREAAAPGAAALVFAPDAAQQRWRVHGATLAWWLSFHPHRR